MRAAQWGRLREEIADGPLLPAGDYEEEYPWAWIIQSTHFGAVGPRWQWWDNRVWNLSHAPGPVAHAPAPGGAGGGGGYMHPSPKAGKGQNKGKKGGKPGKGGFKGSCFNCGETGHQEAACPHPYNPNSSHRPQAAAAAVPPAGPPGKRLRKSKKGGKGQGPSSF